MATCKKRKYEDENRQFRQELEEKSAFIERSGKPLSLICNAALSYLLLGQLLQLFLHFKNFHN